MVAVSSSSTTNAALLLHPAVGSRPSSGEWSPPPEYKAVTLGIKAKDDTKDFPGLRLASFQFQETDEWVEAWSTAEHRHLEARQLPCRRRVDPGQVCSSIPPPKQEPCYYAAVMYRLLGLGRGGY
jgi:hypothetical protein